MTTKNKPNETHAERLLRLRRIVARLKSEFESQPSGKGVGLLTQIRELEQRIRREEMHSISGYRTPKRPVSGGAPGSNRRK